MDAWKKEGIPGKELRRKKRGKEENAKATPAEQITWADLAWLAMVPVESTQMQWKCNSWHQLSSDITLQNLIRNICINSWL